MKYLRLLLVTAALLPHNAFADEETEALKLEVKKLEARIADLEKRQQQKQAAAVAPATAPAQAPGANASSQNVASRLAIVERNQELAQDDARAKAASTPTIDIGNGHGLTVTSPDKQYSLNVRGYAQADDRTFFGNGGTSATNTFLLRAARPIFEAKMTDYFDARLMLDFGQGNSRLLDAYGDFHPMPGSDLVNLRTGEFKVPLGIERWQSEQDLLFVERGLTTNLVPFRDIGAMAYGQLIPNQLEYQLGVVNGAADLQVNNGDTDNNKDVVGRLFAHPLRWSGVGLLEDLGLGVAGSYGVHQGSTTAPGLTTGYLTAAQRSFFTYRAAAGQVVYADGPQWRVNPQLTVYHGPLGLMGEYVLDGQEVTRGGTSGDIRNKAWMAVASYVLTGEDASFDGVKPAHNFDPKNGHWGAFELVSRLDQLSVDRNAFPTFADITASARKADEATIGGTWYFNNSVKLNLDYSFTSFDGGNIGGRDRPDERVLMTRTQVRF